MKKILLIILLVGIVLISGCAKQPSDVKSGKYQDPFKVEITFLQTPKLNDVIDIAVTANDIANYLNETHKQLIAESHKEEVMVVILGLPDAFEYVSGDFQFLKTTDSVNRLSGLSEKTSFYTWSGDVLVNNEQLILNAKIRAIKAGENLPVTSNIGRAPKDPQKTYRFGGKGDTIYVSFDEKSGRVSKESSYEPTGVGAAAVRVPDDCAQREGNILCKGLSNRDEIPSCDCNACRCEMDSNGNLYTSCTEKGCAEWDKRCSMPKPKEIGGCEKIQGYYYDPSSNSCKVISGCSVEGLVPFRYSSNCETICKKPKSNLVTV